MFADDVTLIIDGSSNSFSTVIKNIDAFSVISGSLLQTYQQYFEQALCC